ncbi:hypothetical protein A1O3_05599 [Capronia epimyces CBS 606.96]|uniref:Uncharacterized protein n=1 Tax=Capronia epimyces CBS 606.96 TaxID=1182542 RepID=W9YRM8_9EURO|nr:uncharacterized protein A1O3_05599 [Capronia epimyces CBS 606.96]EXJ84924.1 hypothetical protein A1O3_05599 [Capronia epimyces CBS 606.96]
MGFFFLAPLGLKFARGKKLHFFTDLSDDEALRILFDRYPERRMTNLTNLPPPEMHLRYVLGIFPLKPERAE